MGAAIGGAAGAVAGTMIFPILGTALGGIIGSIAGGFIGSYSFKAMLKMIEEKMKNLKKAIELEKDNLKSSEDDF